jgi:hypothetical protein
MDTGKRTFSLCLKWPFFSFTVKIGDSLMEVEKAAHDAEAAGMFAKGISDLVAMVFKDEMPKSQSNGSNGGRDRATTSRRSASA